MSNSLTSEELKSLIQSVFSLTNNDKKLAILIDIPDEKVQDNLSWLERRKMAKLWHVELDKVKSTLGLEEVNLILYPNVHSNNADLPSHGYFYDNDVENLNVSTLLNAGTPIVFSELLDTHQLLIALTQFSATAPLKLMAQKHNFRGVTMPGFSKEMIPSLKLDYEKINERITAIKKLLDPAEGLEIKFGLPDGTNFRLYFDLRFRLAHASGGRFPDVGTAGNLPGGECYIVPYEGEKDEPSESHGVLPVQFDDEIVLYEIEQNIATNVISKGHYSEIEAVKIKEEPAYANIAEIGFGILRYFGITPIGQILLDEKLGLHIAFGRSDHFGGAVGIKDFKNPENVIHIDRIYIPETQNKIQISYVKIINDDGDEFIVMKDGEYTIF